MAVSIKLKNKYWDTSSIVHGHTDLKTFLNNLILNKVYPVGAIYISTSSTSPATLFGGTWSRIQGQFLLAANDSAAAYNAGKTGGNVTVTLATGNLPSHTHSVGAHAHGLNSHKHSWSGTTSNNGNHEHSVYSNDAKQDRNGAVAVDVGNNGTWGAKIETVSGYHYANADLQAAGAHTHTISGTTGAASGSTANSTAFNTGATGSGTAINIMPPFLAVYVWKRTQ